MKKAKIVASMALIAALVLGMCGCGENSASEGESEEKTPKHSYEDFVGTWYDEHLNPITITEDETVIEYKVGITFDLNEDNILYEADGLWSDEGCYIDYQDLWWGKKLYTLSLEEVDGHEVLFRSYHNTDGEVEGDYYYRTKKEALESSDRADDLKVEGVTYVDPFSYCDIKMRLGAYMGSFSVGMGVVDKDVERYFKSIVQDSIHYYMGGEMFLSGEDADSEVLPEHVTITVECDEEVLDLLNVELTRTEITL